MTANVMDMSIVVPIHGSKIAGLRPTLSDQAPMRIADTSDGVAAKKIRPSM